MNIEKWGLQDLETLTMAMVEELGEVSQAILQYRHEGKSFHRIGNELSDLAALCYQMKYELIRLESCDGVLEK